MKQAQRKTKRDNELKDAKKKIKSRSGGMCEHCKKAPATDTAHNIPRSTDGYKYYSLLSNLHHWCRDCHNKYDQYKVKDFARINVDNFLSLIDYLMDNGQIKLHYKYLDLYNA